MGFDATQPIAQVQRTITEQRFEFASLPSGWLAVGGLVLLLALVWSIFSMYRSEGRRGASLGMRMFLASLRGVVVLALAAVLIEPVLATYIHRWIDSYCIVLIDDSSSMDLRDRYPNTEDAARVKSVLAGGETLPVRRADVLTSVLKRDDNALLNGLAENNRVKVFTFSDTPKLIATLAGPGDEPGSVVEEDDNAPVAVDRFEPTLTAQGPGTNVARALRRSIESLNGAPLAGVVLLTDGGLNQGDPVEVVARYVEEQGVPMHVVGVGDDSPVQNIRVAEVIAPENVFTQDPFTVTANIRTQGLDTGTITVRLFERGGEESDSSIPIKTRVVPVKRDGAVDPVVFEITREKLGQAVYRVEVPEQAAESVPDDNVKQVLVNVIDDKMRVLLVAGYPNWDYRFLSRLLIRDETFDVSCWLQSADTNAVRDGNTIIDHLPSTPEELYEYDAIILIDPDPSEFGPGWARAVDTLVSDYGGGLMYLASRAWTPQFMRDPALRRLVDLLPVTPDAEADLILNRIGYYQTRKWELDIPDDAFAHSIMRLGMDVTEAKQRWSDIEGMYWHYPVMREKPVATVLIRHSNPQMRNSYGGHVLAATQFVGSGRSAFVSFDGTWRWRRYATDLYNQFWVQTMRYLVEGKLLGGKKRATIYTEGESFQLGSTVNVTARLFDARFEPLQADRVDVTQTVGNRTKTFKLKRQLDRPGWYEGRFTPVQTGSYRILLTLPGSGGGEPITATHDVQVVRPNIEIVNPRMDRDALEEIALRSPEGRFYDIDEIDQVVSAIPDRHESTTIKSRPIPLWDRWWTLVLVVGLLSTEWAIRKWVRLL